MSVSVRNKLILVLLTVCAIFAVLAPATVAWLYTAGNEIDHKVDYGSLIKQYFHCGTGTEDDPFVITRPIHYFHLVELYQRKIDFANAGYWFQLGYDDFDGDGIHDGNYKVYDYADDGTLNEDADGPMFSDSLNMAYYAGDYALLPVGTSAVPFIGTFDGKGLTVENLHITATETVKAIDSADPDVVYNTSDLGIFGYVAGDYENGNYVGGRVKNVYYKNVSIDISGLEANVSSKTDATHVEHTDTVYVGYIVGHLRILQFTPEGTADMTNLFEDVYVNNCSVVGGDYSGVAQCNYGYIGGVDVLSGDTVFTINGMIDAAQGSETGNNGAGDSAGFGGSIAMKDLYDRVDAIRDLARNEGAASYVSAENVVVDEVTGETVITVTEESQVNNIIDYSDIGNYAGSYSFYNRTGANVDQFVYVTGLRTETVKTVTTATYKADPTDPSKYLVETGMTVSVGDVYLGINDLNVIETAESGAVVLSGDGSGGLYTYTTLYGKLYLNASQSGASFGTTKSTEWTVTGDEIYCTLNGKKYYLSYINGNGWTLIPEGATAFVITDGAGHFFAVNSDGSQAVANSIDDATKFFFSESGEIFTVVNGTTYYLNGNLGVMKLNATSAGTVWTVDGGGLQTSVNGNLCSLTYRNTGWTLIDPNATYYFVTDGTNYLSTDGTSVINKTSGDDSVLWEYDSSNSYVYTYFDGVKKYLYGSGNFLGTITFSISNNGSAWANADTKMSFSYRSWFQTRTAYLQYNNGWQASTTNPKNGTRIAQTTVTANCATQNVVVSNTVTQKTTEQRVIEVSVASNQPSGYYTYFPLTTKIGDYSGDDELTSEYSASNRNTGYVISGGYETSSWRSDIRISQYSTSDIGTSLNVNDAVTFNDTYDQQMEILTATAATNGSFVRITDLRHNTTHGSVSADLSAYSAMTVADLGLVNYESLTDPTAACARDNLATMLKESGSNIYGLHFMDSRISMDRIITASKVRLFGTEYETYEFPEDCINFYAIQKGTISFFAGTYFSGNDTFFSLHRVYRDSAKHIIAIKEIDKVYKWADEAEEAKKYYVYLYTDGTYTNADGSYTGATSLPAGYSSTPVFDMSWVKNPTIVNDAVYYFEIPCNSGEFALGSVDGKTGAYLFYLDVGANGGGAGGITSVGTENRPTAVVSDYPLFTKVDYRDAAETVDRSIFNFSYTLPSSSTDQFQISVQYVPVNDYVEGMDADEASAVTEWCEGVYRLYITNADDATFDLSVLLCDNDDDPNNLFPFAYEIYVNGVVIANNEGVYSGTLRRWSKTYTVTGGAVS